MFRILLKTFFHYFWNLHSYVLKRNIYYRNKHKGETCYIFGNGASIKYFDITKLPNHITIATTFSLFDNRMKKIIPNYYVIPDQYNFYSFAPIFSVNQKKYFPLTYNYLSILFKKIISNNQNTIFFISITNYYSYFIRPKNLNFFASSSTKEENKDKSFDLSRDFNYLDGSLDVMIGIAKYMGFSKAILIGCDYLGEPKVEGHFYSDETPSFGKPIHDEYFKRIKEISEGIEIMTIFPNNVKSPHFKTFNIQNFDNIDEKYVNNYDIINSDDLTLMRKAAEKNKVYMKISNEK